MAIEQAVILAGGLGKRLRPFTQVIPKPLLPIGETSVLEIQILALKKHGVKEIFIATNYMSEMVEAFLGNGEKYGVSIHFSRETKALGTCGPLALLRDRLTGPFLVMNGDILTTLDFKKAYEFAMASEAMMTIVTKRVVMPFNFGKVIADGDYVIKVEEKPNLDLEALSGIYIFKPEIFTVIPYDQFYGMDSLIHDMLGAKLKIARYQMKEYWLDIGQIDDYETAQNAYREHFRNLSPAVTP